MRCTRQDVRVRGSAWTPGCAPRPVAYPCVAAIGNCPPGLRVPDAHASRVGASHTAAAGMRSPQRFVPTSISEPATTAAVRTHHPSRTPRPQERVPNTAWSLARIGEGAEHAHCGTASRPARLWQTSTHRWFHWPALPGVGSSTRYTKLAQVAGLSVSRRANSAAQRACLVR